MNKVKNPLPDDAFDKNEPVEGEDYHDDIPEDVFEPSVDEYGGLVYPEIPALFFCEWYGCTIKNPEVCTWCGIYWQYFSLTEN